MIRPTTGDLLAVKLNNRYYFALVLSKIKLFGGHFVYVFHKTSEQLLPPEELLNNNPPGFHDFVDFNWSNREGRLDRIATKQNIQPFETITRLKATNTIKGKATLWFIYDMSFKEIKKTSSLSSQEKAYPLFHRIDDYLMCKRIDQAWLPEKDPRI